MLPDCKPPIVEGWKMIIEDVTDKLKALNACDDYKLARWVNPKLLRLKSLNYTSIFQIIHVLMLFLGIRST